MKDNIKEIFSDYEYMLKKFRKNDYIKNMELFRNKWGQTIENTVNGGDFENVSSEMIDKIAEVYTRWGRLGKTRKMDLSLFMIYFIFPAILLTENEKATEFADILLDTWNEKMGTEVEYLAYDEIVASFNDKMFGIF